MHWILAALVIWKVNFSSLTSAVSLVQTSGQDGLYLKETLYVKNCIGLSITKEHPEHATLD